MKIISSSETLVIVGVHIKVIKPNQKISHRELIKRYSANNSSMAFIFFNE
jgi:hypothetical protein